MAEQKPVLVPCSNCDANVAGIVEGSYEVYAEEPGFVIRYLLLKCPKCEAPILANQDDEDARFGRVEEGENWGRTERMYPGDTKRQLALSVPKPIRRAFDEAVACFGAKAFTASAIMCRKVLEAVCETHNAKGKTLAAKLKYLADKGEFDKRLYDWISALRVAGNEAAHDVNVTVSREDAGDLLDFAEVVTEYLYTFREKYETFQKRRAERAKQGGNSSSNDLLE